MRFAIDSSGNRIHIDYSHVKNDYFCPNCGEKVILKKGNIRQHHFAHSATTRCSDSWHYDMSEWHINWQDKFPKENQEIVKNLNGMKHRADVLIEQCKTVIEFQHSTLDQDEFEDRNNFYNLLGYKVIWIFDEAEQYESSAIEKLENRENVYKWRRPRNTLNDYEVSSNVIIYLQLENEAIVNPTVQEYLRILRETGIDDACGPEIDEYYQEHKDDSGFLALVGWKAPTGFERFVVKEYLSTKEFLLRFVKYVNVKQKYDVEDAYDQLRFLYQKDHSRYYQGCPISKTHLAVNCRIDISEAKYAEIRPCEICPYRGENNTCGKKLFDVGINSECEVICFSKDENGSLEYIKYRQDGQEKEQWFKQDIKVNWGESLLALWNQKKPSIATFRNMQTGVYVRLTSDPNLQVKKYGKCYGRLSQEQYSFPPNTLEIFRFDKPEWIMVWSK